MDKAQGLKRAGREEAPVSTKKPANAAKTVRTRPGKLTRASQVKVTLSGLGAEQGQHSKKTAKGRVSSQNFRRKSEPTSGPVRRSGSDQETTAKNPRHKSIDDCLLLDDL